jgi:serine protease Do
MRRIKTFLTCMIVIATPVMAAKNGDIEQLRMMSRGFSKVAEEATPAVVFIRAEVKSQGPGYGENGEQLDAFSQEFFRRFFGGQGGMMPDQQHPPFSHGSGFIVSKDGYILTNNHIVGNAQNIEVRLHDGRKLDATLVGTDPQTDVAVIKIDADDLPFLQLANSDATEVGEWAIAIGSPFGLDATVTVGVISAKGRNELHITDLEDFIQTDAAINPGNSGGPLLDLDGHVVGVNTAIVTGSGGYMGIGFAIPSNMAQRVMDQLIKDGAVTRGFLGVTMQPVDSDLATAFGLDKPTGALVTEVMADSPAAIAGIQQEDIILEFNGQKVDSINGLRNQVSMIEPGSKVNITVHRNGRKLKKTVTIKPHPDAAAGPGTLAHTLGLEVDPLDEKLAQQLNYQNEAGVVVKRVETGSPAAKVGIKPGALIVRVNRTPVTTPDEFYNALEEAAKISDRVLLLVRQGQAMRFVSLKLDK